MDLSGRLRRLERTVRDRVWQDDAALLLEGSYAPNERPPRLPDGHPGSVLAAVLIEMDRRTCPPPERGPRRTE